MHFEGTTRIISMSLCRAAIYKTGVVSSYVSSVIAFN